MERINCPAPITDEDKELWGKLVTEFGDHAAHLAFFRHTEEGFPSVTQAKFYLRIATPAKEAAPRAVPVVAPPAPADSAPVATPAEVREAKLEFVKARARAMALEDAKETPSVLERKKAAYGELTRTKAIIDKLEPDVPHELTKYATRETGSEEYRKKAAAAYKQYNKKIENYPLDSDYYKAMAVLRKEYSDVVDEDGSITVTIPGGTNRSREYTDRARGIGKDVYSRYTSKENKALDEKLGALRNEYPDWENYEKENVYIPSARKSSKEKNAVWDAVSGMIQSTYSKHADGMLKGITRTTMFNKWFGNSVMTHNDASAKPIVFFHGTATNSEFSEFKHGDFGIHFTADPGMAVEAPRRETEYGVNPRRSSKYFTYAEMGKRDPDAEFWRNNHRVIPVFLKAERPVILDDLLGWDPKTVIDALAGKLTTYDKGYFGPYITEEQYNGLSGYFEAHSNLRSRQRQIINTMRKNGYDSVVYFDSATGQRDNEAYSVMVFDATQIKSVYNSGSFDKTNPNIRYATRGSAMDTRIRSKVEEFDPKKDMKDTPEGHMWLYRTARHRDEIEGIIHNVRHPERAWRTSNRGITKYDGSDAVQQAIREGHSVIFTTPMPSVSKLYEGRIYEEWQPGTFALLVPHDAILAGSGEGKQAFDHLTGQKSDIYTAHRSTHQVDFDPVNIATWADTELMLDVTKIKDIKYVPSEKLMPTRKFIGDTKSTSITNITKNATGRLKRETQRTWAEDTYNYMKSLGDIDPKTIRKLLLAKIREYAGQSPKEKTHTTTSRVVEVTGDLLSAIHKFDKVNSTITKSPLSVDVSVKPSTGLARMAVLAGINRYLEEVTEIDGKKITKGSYVLLKDGTKAYVDRLRIRVDSPGGFNDKHTQIFVEANGRFPITDMGPRMPYMYEPHLTGYNDSTAVPLDMVDKVVPKGFLMSPDELYEYKRSHIDEVKQIVERAIKSTNYRDVKNKVQTFGRYKIPMHTTPRGTAIALYDRNLRKYQDALTGSDLDNQHTSKVIAGIQSSAKRVYRSISDWTNVAVEEKSSQVDGASDKVIRVGNAVIVVRYYNENDGQVVTNIRVHGPKSEHMEILFRKVLSTRDDHPLSVEEIRNKVTEYVRDRTTIDAAKKAVEYSDLAGVVIGVKKPYYSTRPAGFYSKLEEAIKEKYDENSSIKTDSLRAWLKTNPNGAKADEINFSGLYDLIKGKTRIPIKDVLNHIREHSPDVLNDSTRTDYSNLVLPGGRDYQEDLTSLGGHFSEDAPANHHGEPGVVVHARSSVYDLPGGKTALFAHEIQSDWHSQGANQGYRDPENPTYPEEAKTLNDKFNKDLEDLTRRTENDPKLRSMRDRVAAIAAKIMRGDPNAERTEYSTLNRELSREHTNLMQEEMGKLIDKFSADTNALHSKHPDWRDWSDKEAPVKDAPFKDSWYQLAVKKLLLRAAKEGHEYFAWSKTREQVATIEGWPTYDPALNEGMFDGFEEPTAPPEEHGGVVSLYTEKIPNFLKKYLKKYGGVEQVELPGSSTKIWEGPRVDNADISNAAEMEEDGAWGATLEELAEDADSENMGFPNALSTLGPRDLARFENQFGGKLAEGSNESVNAVHITPDMRKDLLEKGQTLYSTRMPPAQRAGSINLDHLDIPQELKDFFTEELEDAIPAMQEQSRGVRGWETTEQAARRLQLSSQDMARIAPGTAVNAETSHAIASVMLNLANKAQKAAQEFQKDPADAIKFGEYMATHEEFAAASATFSGVTAEAGRALGYYRKLRGILREYKGSDQRDRALKKLAELLGSDKASEQKARLLAIMPSDDPTAAMRFLLDAKKSKVGDMLFTYFVSNLLSGPATHARSFLGNSVYAATLLIEKPIRGVVDAQVAKVQGRPQEYFAEEAVPAAVAMVKSIPEAFQKMIYVWHNGFTPDMASAFDINRVHELPGNLKNPFNWSTRAIFAADTFTRHIATQGDLTSQATRMAMAEGIRGRALSRRISDLVSSPTQEMLDEAASVGTQSVFFTRTTTSRAVNTLRNNIPGMKFVMPIVLVPTNMLLNGLDYTPFGLRHYFDKEVREGKSASEVGAKLAIGSVLMGMGAYWAHAGLLTGPAPSSQKEKNAFFRSGKQPFSLKVGNKYIPIRLLGPLAMPLTVVASWHESWKSKGSIPTTADVANAAFNIPRELLQASYLRGVSELFDAINKPDTSGNRFMGNIATGFVPFSGALRQTAYAMDDAQRNPKSLGDYITNIIPGASKTLPERIDSFGNIVKRPSGLMAFAPEKASTASNDPLEVEMARLQIYPPDAAPSYTVAGKHIKLSGIQTRNFQRQVGKAVHQAATDVISGEGYQDMADEDKKVVLEKAMVDARIQARADYYNTTLVNQYGVINQGR